MRLLGAGVDEGGGNSAVFQESGGSSPESRNSPSTRHCLRLEMGREKMVNMLGPL